MVFYEVFVVFVLCSCFVLFCFVLYHVCLARFFSPSLSPIFGFFFLVIFLL